MFSIKQLFQLQKLKFVLKSRFFFFFFVKKLKILCSSDSTILFKFHQPAACGNNKECMEKLQTSNVSISNDNTKEFKRHLLKKNPTGLP